MKRIAATVGLLLLACGPGGAQAAAAKAAATPAAKAPAPGQALRAVLLNGPAKAQWAVLLRVFPREMQAILADIETRSRAPGVNVPLLKAQMDDRVRAVVTQNQRFAAAAGDARLIAYAQTEAGCWSCCWRRIPSCAWPTSMHAARRSASPRPRPGKAPSPP